MKPLRLLLALPLLLLALASISARGVTVVAQASTQPPRYTVSSQRLDLYRGARRPTGALAIEGFPVGEVCVVMPRTGSPAKSGDSTRLALYAYSHTFSRWMEVKPPTPLTQKAVREALTQAETEERRRIAARQRPPWEQTLFGAPSRTSFNIWQRVWRN